MNKYALLALLLVAFNASATKTNEGCQGNCPSTGGGSNEANNHANSSSSSSSNAGAVGVGVGVGLGGDGGNATATATGGAGGDGGNGYGGSAIGLGGSGGHSSSGVKDSGNSFNANTAKGGDASQGQLQGQQQSSKSIAQMASENTAVLKNQNANNSQASGNTTVTNVGGDSTVVERNAPPVFLGAIMPTSCGGSIQAGASDRNGSGAFGVSWVGSECSIRMIGDRYQQLGMVDTACEVYKSTKAFQKAAKRNPKLADLDCSVKPAPVPVPAPAVVAPELAPRVPRG